MAKLKRSLKSCPFCGARAAVAYKCPRETDIFSAFCTGCGACTEWYNTAKKARKAWNRREKGGTNA